MKPLPDHEARRQVLREFAANLVVTAGAGTGKTSLLVGRLLSALLRQHMEPSRIVALTFTENATSEMRARLVRLLRAVPAFVAGRELEKIATSDAAVLRELTLGPPAVVRALEILAIADRLQISTFHGFCLRFLQRYARRLGLPTRITLVEPEAARIAFDAEFVSWLGKRGRDELRPALAATSASGLREIAWQLGSIPEDTVLERPEPPDLSGMLREITAMLAQHPKALPLFRTFLAELLSVCKALANGLRPAVENPERYSDKRKVPKPGPSAATDPDVHARVCTITTKLAPWVIGDDDTIAAAVRFVLPFVAEHRTRRARAGTLTFDELVLTVRRALMFEPAVRAELAMEIQTLLVDEFQDTDPLQYEIVFLLAADAQAQPGIVTEPMQLRLRKGVLCGVGDVKQSIYRFRRADVAAYGRAVDAILAQGGQRLVLAANFRSRPPILEFTNRVCATSLRADLPWQQAYENVLPTRDPDQGAGVELVRLQLPDGASASARRDAEGMQVVATIARLIAAGRPAGQIAVLLRAAADTAWLLRPLRESGIPYALRGGKRFYARHEVVVGTALVRAIACPHDSVAVLAILRSSLCGATDRAIHDHVTEHGALDYLGAAGTDMVATAFSLLRELRAEVVAVPLDLAIRRLLTGPEMLATQACGYEGAQRLANLERLCASILEEQPLDLVAAAALLERRTQRESEDEESPLFDHDQDAVRIMTVHASKGLEFPVVIVPDIGREADHQDRSPEQIRVERWNDDGMRAAVAVRIGAMRNALGWLAKSAAQHHSHAEQRRLFYVAVTRAQEYLVLIAPAELSEHAIWLKDLVAAIPDADPAWHFVAPPTVAAKGPTLAASPERTLAALAAWQHRTAAFTTASPEVIEPSALQGETLTYPSSSSGKLLGRVMHEYLATVALDRSDCDHKLLRELLAREPVPVADAVASDAQGIAVRFHACALRRRLVAANTVYREYPLTECRSDGSLVLGMLDVLMIERDGLPSVLDYKTESVAAGGHATAAARHQAQLDAYADGVRVALRLTERPRRLVHFLRDDVTVELGIA